MKPPAQITQKLALERAEVLLTQILPPSGEIRAIVLFLLPLMEERKGTLPLVIHAAREWTGLKIGSVFFDYTGCGDSAGFLEELTPDQVDRETADVLQWIHLAYPTLPICIVGTRISSCLPSRLTRQNPPNLSALIYWSPIDGEAFLKQLFQRRMINDMVAYGKAKENRKELVERLGRGETIDLDGFALTPSLYTWLQGLRPYRGREAVSIPTLLIDGGHDIRSAALFAETGAECLTLRYPPFWNTVGQVDLEPLIHTTGDWLDHHLPAETQHIQFDHVEDPDYPSLSTEGDGMIRLALNRPTQEPRGGILFLPGWSGDRTGPHRIFTRAARLFAAEGYLCARVDFTGRGCSDGLASDASILQMSADAEHAYSALRALLPRGKEITVLAICSGCKVAITLAASHPELAQLILWSAESMGSLRDSTTGIRKALHMLKAYARKSVRPETWKKILRGKVDTQLVAKALVKHEKRSQEEAQAEDCTLRRFRSFTHPILFIYGGSDPDAAGSANAYGRFCGRYRIPYRLHTIAHAGHSYYGETWSQELLTESIRFLRDPKVS